MKLADYVIQYLRDIGIKKVFVVYGGACGDLIDAFTRIDGIDYVCMFHEQACSFAAETYAKVSGNLSACIATSGPGGINLLQGIANCFYDSTPCLFITGQINSKFLKSDPSLRQVGFQENDIVGMSKPITKMAEMVKRPEDIRYILKKAIHTATSGRPGPVLIDIPLDIQKAEIDPSKLSKYITRPRYGFNDRCLAQFQIHDFLKDYRQSKRPVLLIGGGVRIAGATEEVRQLAKWLKIPCIPTWNAIDIITSDFEYYRGRVGTFGGPGRNFAIQNADLLLSIGCRMSGRITGGDVSSFAKNAKKYIVDTDRALLDPTLQQVKGDVNIYCDAQQFIQYLMQHSHFSILPDNTEWLNKTLEWREKYQPCLPEYYNQEEGVNPYVFIKTLSEELCEEDIIVADCGGNVVVTYQGFETKWGQRLISSHGNSPMGFAFSGAIGACLATDRRVICLIGDGGFNMNIQELQTLINYNIPLKVFIMNNKIYGITQQFQDTHFESRYEACGPKGYNPPDFMEIVRAYGINEATITSQDQTDPTMREMINLVVNWPYHIVCDVNMYHWHTYEPRVVGWDTPIEDMSPKLSREELQGNMLQ